MKVVISQMLDRDIVRFMRQYPTGVNMPRLAFEMPVPDDRLHGRQHSISLAIERLRRKKVIEDVPNRCPHCGRPPRKRRVVELLLTQLGKTCEMYTKEGFKA